MADDKKTKNNLNNPNAPQAKFKLTGLRVGASHTQSVMRPPLIVDAHMHIQSGHCAPMPFLWRQVPGGGLSQKLLFGETLPPRSKLDNMETILVDGNMAKKQIAKILCAAGVFRLSDTSEPPSNEVANNYITNLKMETLPYLLTNDEYKNIQVFFLSMVMTMDMEYAHLYGYHGIKIYNGIYREEDLGKPDAKPIHYWYPQYLDENWNKNKDGNFFREESPAQETFETDAMDEKGYDSFQTQLKNDHGISKTYQKPDTTEGSVKIQIIPVLAPDEETKLYEDWDTQVLLTKQAIMANPLQFLPLYHYDPRRWQVHGNNQPFEQVTGKGLFVGFKMYTAQGYRPLDRRLPILEEYYARCEQQGIPIMNHCTPEGAPTYDSSGYYYFQHPLDTKDDENEHKEFKWTYNGANKYFTKYFVSPDAWEPVLEKHPRLRLCLAHFGGNIPLGRQWGIQIIEMMSTKKYPNLYTDISSSFAIAKFRDYFKEIIIKYPHIADRIMFGTDWYLHVREVPSHLDYTKTAKQFLDGFDTSLWPKFTLYNPYRFYQLDKQMERVAKNIEEKRKQPDIKQELKKFEDNEIAEMYKTAAYIKKLKDIYPIY